MDYCQRCQNITFYPQASNDFQDFVAVLHPSLEALRESASRGTCNLCIILFGMILHRELGKPHETSSRRDHIELSFSYLEKGEWTGIDDDAEDITKHLAFTHPLGVDSFVILNPNAISRSSWTTEKEDARVSLDHQTLRESALMSAANHLDVSTGSDAALALASTWMRTCKTNHPSCQKPSGTVLEPPKRLLDVSRATGHFGTIFLVCFDPQTVRSHEIRYATLSHRWNPEDACVTTTLNQEMHVKRGMFLSQLSKTFADACITSNKLGIRYIWIDSLCILQDSDEDKLREIPKMGKYYQNSEINISASSETTSGLWCQRDGRATKPLKMPITINLPSPYSHSRRVILEVAPVLYGPKSHLDSRGWVLQERIFPRRTLFFDPYWISFQCGESSNSENCPAGIRIDANTGSQALENEMGTHLNRDCSLAIMGSMLLEVQASTGDLGIGERRPCRCYHFIGGAYRRNF
jgi:hypothetical protein